MSIFIESNNVIHIRRGDSGILPVVIRDKSGTQYILGAGDSLYLTIRERARRDSPILLQLATESGSFVFNPSDTSDIPVGKYSCDIELRTSGGDIHTVFPKTGESSYERESNWKNFCIEAEVT